MRGKKSNDQTRAAVMAALLSGQSVSEVAKSYNLSKSTVCGLKKSLSSNELEHVRTKKLDEFGDLLAKYLKETLITLSAQMEFVRDKQWLRQQEAAQVATLIGVATDKAIRLLEAAQASQEDISE